MKRYWLFMALLLAGLGGYAHASTFTNGIQAEAVMSPNDPTETELQVLQKAAPILGIAYSELLSMYQSGEATIEQDADGTWVVTAYMSGGDILVVLIEGSI
jgi:hypothetical protein